MHAVVAVFRIACLAMLLCVGRSFLHSKVLSRGVVYQAPLGDAPSAGIAAPTLHPTPCSTRRSRLQQSRDEATLLPNYEDMQHMAMILANMTDSLDSSPDVAMSIVSQQLGWLYSRDVPKLTQMLLAEFPSLRQDKGMMRSYMFLLDFLEAVGKETATRLKGNQGLLRSLLEKARMSEESLDDFITANSEKLLNGDFSLYLDTEVEAAESNSPQENLLVTIKLRLLDECGKNLGVDVMLLPKLAAEGDPAELRRKTLQHLDSYDKPGQELFLQTLRIMMGEMKKRYQGVDPLLYLNLREVEKITQGYLER